ncbi:MAG TPA: hypothetical protein PKY59_24630, partial [Pyrinomonadaceae bacterium]|nr:hypothetical protein [Pyrinomonadaceae bacterium]
MKTDLGKDPKNINEDKPELWNKYSSPENAFEIEFPSKTENVFKDNPVENIVLFEAKTGKATYSVIVKPFESKVLPDEVEILYDQLTEQLFLKGSGK